MCRFYCLSVSFFSSKGSLWYNVEDHWTAECRVCSIYYLHSAPKGLLFMLSFDEHTDDSASNYSEQLHLQSVILNYRKVMKLLLLKSTTSKSKTSIFLCFLICYLFLFQFLNGEQISLEPPMRLVLGYLNAQSSPSPVGCDGCIG